MSAFSREKKNMTLLIIDFMSYMKRLSPHVSNNQYGALMSLLMGPMVCRFWSSVDECYIHVGIDSSVLHQLHDCI